MKILLGSAVLCAIAFLARGASASEDPRRLSEISIQDSRECYSDPSDDGRMLYTICPFQKSHSSQSAKFYVHDIGDLRHPREISVVDTGQVTGDGLIVRGTKAFLRQYGDYQGFAIFDLHEPAHPKIVSRVEEKGMRDAAVSSDGRYIILKTWGDKYIFFDISNADVPKKLAPEPSKSDDIVAHREKYLFPYYESAHIEGVEGNVEIHDYRDNEGLLGHIGPDLQLYQFSASGSPTLVTSFLSPEGSLFSVIVPKGKAILVGIAGGPNFLLRFESTKRSTPFDLEFLKHLYAEMAKKYPSCTNDVNYSMDCSDLRFNGLARLKDAGIEQLIASPLAGITAGQRILMLNDYGFWLYKFEQHDRASLEHSAAVLRRVVELAPKRAAAWLNLGDTLFATLPLMETDVRKATLWTEARQAYAQYKELTGKDAPKAVILSNFDLPTAIHATSNVCDYVAKAFSTLAPKMRLPHQLGV